MAELTYEPQPHPYLHEPRIFVSGLPLWITDVHLANALQFCAPFRPNIIRDPTQPLAAGTIEFRFLEKGEASFKYF
jgi:polyadenylate-binding protein